MKISIVLSLLAFSLAMSAADLTTASGDVYKDYNIINTNTSGGVISYSGGVVTIPLKELPKDLQEKYAPKVKMAQEKAKKKQEQKQLSAALARITLFLEGEVQCIQVLSNGVLANHGWYNNNFFITDLDTGNLVDGMVLPHNSTGMVNDWDAIFSGKYGAKKKGTGVRIYCIGTKSYTAKFGNVKTIPLFTANRQVAIEYLRKHPDATVIGMQKNDLSSKESGFDIQRRMNYDNKLRNQEFRRQQRRYR